MKNNKKLISLGLLSLLLVGCNHGGVKTYTKEQFKSFYDGIKTEANRNFKLGDAIEIIVSRKENNTSKSIKLASSGIKEWEGEKKYGEALEYSLDKTESGVSTKFSGSLSHVSEEKTITEDKDSYFQEKAGYIYSEVKSGYSLSVSTNTTVKHESAEKTSAPDTTTVENTFNENTSVSKVTEGEYVVDRTQNESYSYKKVNSKNPTIVYKKTINEYKEKAGVETLNSISSIDHNVSSASYIETTTGLRQVWSNNSWVNESGTSTTVQHTNYGKDNWQIVETTVVDTYDDKGSLNNTKVTVDTYVLKDLASKTWTLTTSVTETDKDPVTYPEKDVTEEKVAPTFDDTPFEGKFEQASMLDAFKATDGLAATIDELNFEYHKAYNDFETTYYPKNDYEILYQNGVYQYRAAIDANETKFVQYSFFDKSISSIDDTPVISEIASFTRKGHRVYQEDKVTFIYTALTPLA